MGVENPTGRKLPRLTEALTNCRGNIFDKIEARHPEESTATAVFFKSLDLVAAGVAMSVVISFTHFTEFLLGKFAQSIQDKIPRRSIPPESS